MRSLSGSTRADSPCTERASVGSTFARRPVDIRSTSGREIFVKSAVSRGSHPSALGMRKLPSERAATNDSFLGSFPKPRCCH